MNRTCLLVIMISVGMLGLLLTNGCSRKPALTVRAYIDGSDVIKVSGDRLWFEHATGSLPGKLIHINGQIWTPTWLTNGISSEFLGLKPPFRAGAGHRIQVTRLMGRGVASIQQFPSADNDQTLAARIDDEEFGGADWYEIGISW